MDMNETRDVVKFWFILGFIQAKITESSDLFEKNWEKFSSVFIEPSNDKQATDDSEEPVPEKNEEKE